jgi:integrase
MAGLIRQMEDAGYGATTIRDAFSITRSVLDHAVGHGVIAANPAKLLPSRELPRAICKRTRALSAHEIVALLNAAVEPYRTMFMVGIFAGLRSGELRGLQRHDIDIPNGLISVRRQAQDGELVPPKTPSSTRNVSIDDPLLGALERFLAREPELPPSSLLFPDKGRPVRAPRLLYQLRKTATRAGVKQAPEQPLSFHELRHAYASILIAANTDPAYVADSSATSRPTSRSRPTPTCSTGRGTAQESATTSAKCSPA